jgi:hypothetical protein
MRRIHGFARSCAAFFVPVLLVGAWVALDRGTAGATVGGPVCNVPADYATIQAAVNDTGCSTVNVAAGTYNEQVQITHTLTLNGAKAGVDARTRSTSGESIITNSCGPVQIMADNVVIDGFTIEGSTDGDPCFLAGIWTNPGFSGTQGGHQIVNNIVQNNISGIELDNTCAANPTLVQHNLIQNNSNPGPGSGNGIQVNFGLCKATIDENTFSGDTNSSVFISSGADQQVTVSDNQLVGGSPERIIFGAVAGGTISGNVSNGSTSSGVVRLFGGNSNIAVTANVLLNGVRGVFVDNLFSPNSGVTVHQNCITGNSTAGLEVATTGVSDTVNAENNWWGAASGPKHNGAGPGTGDNIVDPGNVVTFSPFLTAPTASPCPAPPPTVPGPPRSPSAVPGNAKATVSWKTPSSNGGSPINGYVVTPVKNGVAQPAHTFNSTATTEVVTGLTNGASYKFRVAARNAVGTGAASSTGGITPGAPGAPSKPTVTHPGAGKLKVSFKAPADNGAAITSYTATCASSNGGATKSKSGSSTMLTVIGLTAGKTYTCRATATNSRGTGPRSAPSAAITA